MKPNPIIHCDVSGAGWLGRWRAAGGGLDLGISHCIRSRTRLHERAPRRVGTRHETNLTVLLADEDEEALQSLGEVLQELGHEVTPFAVSVAEAAELIGREDPDLTIVVVHQDDDHALALIAEAVETASGPVIAQLRGRDDVDFVARAAERGISAYVESNDPQAVQASIEVTIRRYREAARLNEKVEPARVARSSAAR